jgi:hypothetical protein
MRYLSIAILVMVVFAFGPAKFAQADDFSFSVGFRDELSPYGSWMNYSNYGNVWRPYGHSNFRPYSDGYWGYTNSGPTWYGNEPYASYVYHYGNWVYSPQYGWVWIPGNEWHPGRVQWSHGGGYIGWRPSFPSGSSYGGYGDGYGYGYGNDYNLWVVIDSNRFGYQNYRPYAYRSSFVRDLFRRQVFRQRYNTFRRAELERIVRRPVRVVNVRERAVRIGDRRGRILVTPDEEVRIRKHVTQIRGRGDNRRAVERDDNRRSVERDTVMRKKFDDIRTKSTKKEVRRDDSRRDDDSRRTIETRKSDSRRPVVTNRNVERVRGSKKVITTKKKVENSRPNMSRASISRGRDNDTKVERVSRTVQKSEVRPNSRGKAQVSRANKTVKKESVRKQKPRKRN